MKKILNKDVSNVVDEMLLGYLTAYKSFYKKVDGFNAFYYRGHREKKVALVVGGGSGHEPMFSGFCGLLISVKELQETCLGSCGSLGSQQLHTI